MSYSTILEGELAAWDRGISPDAWDEMSTDARARVIAVVRCRDTMAAVVQTYGGKDKPKGRRR